MSIRSDAIGELKTEKVYSSISEGRKDNFSELDDYNYVGVSFSHNENLLVHEMQYFSISDAIIWFGGFYKSWTLFITIIVTPFILK